MGKGDKRTFKGKVFKEPLHQMKTTLELRVFKEKTTLAKIRPHS